MTMKEKSENNILKEITDFYLNSNDFNGIPNLTLMKTNLTDWDSIKVILKKSLI